MTDKGPRGDEEGAPEDSPAARQVLGRLREAVATARASEAPADILWARADSPAAMKIVALLVSGSTRQAFRTARSRRNWQRAVADIEEARQKVVSSLQAHMGPAAGAIFLAKLAAAICDHHGLDAGKLERLLRHFAAPEGSGARLPPDILLELGASFSSQESAPPGESDYDEP